MKSVITIIFFLSILTCKAQTEQETISFLNSMFASNCAPLGGEPTKYEVTTGIDPHSNKKVIIFDHIVGNELFSTQRVHAKDISSVTPFRAPNGNLCLKVVSSNGLILRKWAGKEDEYFESNIQMALLSTDEEVERIKKALIHFFKLNGSKFSDNSLFKS